MTKDDVTQTRGGRVRARARARVRVSE